jgi:hypothetical protein
LEVELTFSVDKGLVIAPAGLPGYEAVHSLEQSHGKEGVGSCALLALPQLELQLRTNADYMGK